MDFFERESRIAWNFVQTHYQAWELRQQGKTFKEIGEIMKVDKSWPASMVSFVNLKIKYRKQKKISNELISLINKYSIKNKHRKF